MSNDFEISLTQPASIAVYPPGATYGPRSLLDFEFVWMIQGDALYERDGQSFTAPESSMVLCTPGVIDSFRWDEKQKTRHAYFHFAVHRYPGELGAIADWAVVRRLPEDDILRPLFRHLLAWGSHAEPGYTHLTIAHILSAYVTGRIAAANIAPEVWPEAVERVWNFMFRRLDDDAVTAEISLEEFAGVACVSPEHLCRVFKAATGYSPLEAWRLARLDRALTLLLRSNYSIAQIAAITGFASQFHFSRRFREIFGQAPSELRAAVRAGAPAPAARLVHRQRIAPR